jgi:hypothetical protein
MNWKEFLIPEWRKIVLTIIFILVFPLQYWNGILCEMCTPEIEPCSCSSFNFGPAIIGWYFAWKGNIGGSYAMDVLQGIVIQLLLIGLPISYLLSCLIVWVYDKVKKKNNL